MNWGTYKIGPHIGGLVYCPLEIAIQIAKRDGEPWVKDLSNGDVIIWKKDADKEE